MCLCIFNNGIENCLPNNFIIFNTISNICIIIVLEDINNVYCCLKIFSLLFYWKSFPVKLLLFVWNCFVDFAFFGKNKLNWITFKFNNCFIDWVSPLYLGIKSCVFFSVESFLLSILLICLEKTFIQKFQSDHYC